MVQELGSGVMRIACFTPNSPQAIDFTPTQFAQNFDLGSGNCSNYGTLNDYNPRLWCEQKIPQYCMGLHKNMGILKSWFRWSDSLNQDWLRVLCFVGDKVGTAPYN
jgi:hypothetical protein